MSPDYHESAAQEAAGDLMKYIEGILGTQDRFKKELRQNLARMSPEYSAS